jgi:hypothetical protein
LVTDLLMDGRASAAAVERALARHGVPDDEEPYQVLMDSVIENGVARTLRKLDTLRHRGLRCPKSVFDDMCTPDTVDALMGAGISEMQVSQSRRRRR